MISLHNIFILSLFLLGIQQVSCQDNINGIFQNIPLSSQYFPTSAVSVAENNGDTFDIFYRGPKFQLLYAVLDSSGVIRSTRDLGGILLTAPSAVSPSAGSFVVSYVTLKQRVVFRTFSSNSWSGEKSAGIRSANTPAAVVNPDPNDEIVLLYVTAVNSQLNEVLIKNGNAQGTPTRFAGVFTPNAPAALYSYGEEGIIVYIKDEANDVFSRSSEAGGPFTRIRDIPKLSSDIGVCNIGEGGRLVLGRGFYRNIEPIFNFEDDFDRRSWNTAPWISDAPGCRLGPFSCSVIVVTSGSKMSFSQYCN